MTAAGAVEVSRKAGGAPEGSTRQDGKIVGYPAARIPTPLMDQRFGVDPAAKAAAVGAPELVAYQHDVWERTILFWGALRQRADNMLEHERAGLPPLLDFKSETLLDARRFDRAVNYALLRITEVGEDCWDDCVDPNKAPVIVVDPRAGHGPGIGGFKRDSEVGISLHEGHPVYFVIFFPEPCRGQTLADVLHALRRFVEEVARRHPGQPPILYGNCQAGWALALLSADCQGLTGPVVLNGSPLSYWAGESGVNPMRIAGGLTGGVWATRLLADLERFPVGLNRVDLVDSQALVNERIWRIDSLEGETNAEAVFARFAYAGS